MFTALGTVAVAIVLALTVPLSQLRVQVAATSCCCPDPDRCQCPDHDLSTSSDSTMRACHSSEEAIVTPPLPGFMPAAPIALRPVIQPGIVVRYTLLDPHRPPSPRRPDAPS